MSTVFFQDTCRLTIPSAYESVVATGLSAVAAYWLDLSLKVNGSDSCAVGSAMEN